MDQLIDHKVNHVSTLPGTSIWISSGKKEGALATGVVGDGKPRALTYGGKKAFDHTVIAMCGVDASTVVMTDGVWVTRLSLAAGARALKPLQRVRLPGELGWNAGLAAARDLVVVASDLRLGAWDGAAPRFVEAKGGFGENFRAPAILPDGETIVVGRGDGRVELRDARTLELRKTFPAVREAVLATCVLDEHTVAVAGDMADTVLLDLHTGDVVSLPCHGMKTSGLHRLPDGKLLVVGLSRRVAIFDGATLVRDGDLSGTLGDRYVQESAVAAGTLLAACEEKGLWTIALDALPQDTPAALPAPAEAIRAHATRAAELALLEGQIGSKQDIAPAVAKLLAKDDETLRRGVFLMLATTNTALPDAPTYLTHALPRVRYYAADHYGQMASLFTTRAPELRPALADADPTVVAAATWALGRLGDAQAGPWIEPLLRHDAQGVRATATASLLALRTGEHALLAALRDGAGEISWSILATLHPKLTPALMLPAPPELLASLAAGARLLDVLGALSIAATPTFLAAHPGPVTLALPPGTMAYQVLYALAIPARWPATFDGTTITLTTSTADAAAFWADALARR